jgi:hypothetical protein
MDGIQSDALQQSATAGTAAAEFNVKLKLIVSRRNSGAAGRG